MRDSESWQKKLTLDLLTSGPYCLRRGLEFGTSYEGGGGEGLSFKPDDHAYFQFVEDTLKCLC